LYAYKITGVKTSIPFLARIMENDVFKSGNYNTHFIEEHMDFLMDKKPCGDRCQDIALIAAYIHYKNKLDMSAPKQSESSSTNSWKEFGRRKSALGL
jgi:acetyl-CoA carboxylase biotin carboxylase subunit